jgi:hypothetical protein
MSARVMHAIVRTLALAAMLTGAFARPAQADIPSSVTITANGQGNPLTLAQGSSLQIAVAADGGTLGFANPSDMYIGLSTPSALLWLAASGFTTTVTALYHGPLATFGSVTLFNIPNVSVLPAGTYTWFILVNGANGLVGDSVLTSIVVIVPPSITSLSPSSGFAGASVTIAGANFGVTKSTSTVTFNGIAATTTAWSDTSIVATVPTTATTGNVMVTVLGVPSNGQLFTIPTLTSIAVTPSGLPLPLKSQQQYLARGTYSDSSVWDLTAAATWTSSNTAIATVASGGLLAAIAQGLTTVQAAVGPVSGSTTTTVTPSRFMRVGDLYAARVGHTATLLLNGKALIVGGQGNSGILASAELYDPATGAFTQTGSLSTARENHTATLLPSGLVLIAGGLRFEADAESLASAELYDPLSGTFSPGGTMHAGHYSHSATLLTGPGPNAGKVLIAGGRFIVPGGGGGQSPAELYDPATQTFTLTGDLMMPRELHTATLLQNGKVLVVGGTDVNGSMASAEIYSPATGSFSASTGNLSVARSYHTATLLDDGRVLVTGGLGVCPVECGAEIYDPVTQTFSTTGRMSTGRAQHSGTLLADHSILVIGGVNLAGGSILTGTAEVFDPLSQTFTAAGALTKPRSNHTETRLLDGTVLIAGGFITAGNSRMVEVYTATPPVPDSLEITPATVTMRVGNTLQFTAIDSIGRARGDVVWMVSPSLATLSADPAPSLTAVTAGNVTLSASVDGVTAQTQITILSATASTDGLSLWSLPPIAGLTTNEVVHAVPSGNGPDVYAISGDSNQSAPSNQFGISAGVSNHTFIQALTLDGRQLWQQWLPNTNGNSVPDAFGGLIVTEFNTCDYLNPMRIVDYDGATGEWRWELVAGSVCTTEAPQFALRRDGSIVLASPGNTSGLPELMILNGLSGQVVLQPQIPQSTFAQAVGPPLSGYSRIGPPMVGPDGAAYVEYEVRQVAYPVQVTASALWLMKVAMDGSTLSTQLTSTTTNTNLFPGRVIPDGQNGVVATWTFSPADNTTDPAPLRAARVSAAGTVTAFNLPIQPAQVLKDSNNIPVNPALALGGAATAFVTYGPQLASFDPGSGTPQWSYLSPSSEISIVAADSTNGITAKTTAADGSEALVRFNASGSATFNSLPAMGRLVEPVDGEFWASFSAGGVSVFSNWSPDLAPIWYSWNQRRINRAMQPHTIAVRCRSIQDAPDKEWYIRAAFLIAMHCYIVTKAPDGSVTTIEGGELAGRRVGTLVINFSNTDSNGTNRPTDPQYFSTDDANAAATAVCLNTMGHQLHQAAVPYDFLGPNSNRAAFELMAACGRFVILPLRAVGAFKPLATWR